MVVCLVGIARYNCVNLMLSKTSVMVIRSKAIEQLIDMDQRSNKKKRRSLFLIKHGKITYKFGEGIIKRK